MLDGGSPMPSHLTIGPEVVPCCGSYLESCKVIPKRNLGAYGYITVCIYIYMKTKTLHIESRDDSTSSGRASDPLNPDS